MLFVVCCVERQFSSKQKGETEPGLAPRFGLHSSPTQGEKIEEVFGFP